MPIPQPSLLCLLSATELQLAGLGLTFLTVVFLQGAVAFMATTSLATFLWMLSEYALLKVQKKSILLEFFLGQFLWSNEAPTVILVLL